MSGSILVLQVFFFWVLTWSRFRLQVRQTRGISGGGKEGLGWTKTLVWPTTEVDEKSNVVDIVILKADEEENEDKNFELYHATIPIYSLDNKDNSSKPGSESRGPGQPR